MILQAGRGWEGCRAEVDDWPRRAVQHIDSATLVSEVAAAKPQPFSARSLSIRPQVLCSNVCVTVQLHMAEPGRGWGKDQRTAQLLLKFIISILAGVAF